MDNPVIGVTISLYSTWFYTYLCRGECKDRYSGQGLFFSPCSCLYSPL